MMGKRRVVVCQTTAPSNSVGLIAMTDAVVDALILDLLEWLAKAPRSYDEVMDAWRTSCPKLPVWEDAVDRGLVTREDVSGRCVISISPAGHALLATHRNG